MDVTLVLRGRPPIRGKLIVWRAVPVAGQAAAEPMCLGYPAQVVVVDGAGATVDDGTRRRRASTLVMPDVAAGEWVLVATGAIVARLDAREAAEIRAMLEEAGAMRPKGAPDASC